MPARSPRPDPPEPPFYEATEDLFIGGHAGTMPVAAYREGSRVSPAAVKKHGWQGQVRVPAEFAPEPDPGTGPGTSKEE